MVKAITIPIRYQRFDVLTSDIHGADWWDGRKGYSVRARKDGTINGILYNIHGVTNRPLNKKFAESLYLAGWPYR